MYDDTIVAIATPPGEGGMGVVRLSGPESWPIVRALFDGKLEDRRASHGLLHHPRSGGLIDEAVVTAMAAPHTYTREDVVEVSCHGSPVVLQRVIQAALELGARLAGPGEFTLRAFLNGRLDLSQAESVLDIIQAQTEAGARMAVQGLQGRLSESILRLRQRLLEVQAYLTACIDFPEDEVEAQIDIDPAAVLGKAEAEVDELLASAEAGMVYRHGVRTAIAGQPNVGKSSLLNRLLGEDRAIVTPIPGTTRDTVEEVAKIEGIPFYLVDTAGIHETDDVVERAGIERSRRSIGQAEVLLLVIDASRPLTAGDRDVMATAQGKAAIAVANKCDMPVQADLDSIEGLVVRVSALTGDGIPDLHRAMAEAAMGGKVVPSDAVLVTNPRHAAALERCRTHVQAARQSLVEGRPDDFATIDLASALGALAEITGEEAGEELLDAIFSKFCIGK